MDCTYTGTNIAWTNRKELFASVADESRNVSVNKLGMQHLRMFA